MPLFFWRRVRPRVICYGSCDSHFDRTGPSTRLEPWRLSTTSILNRKGGSALGLASSAAEKKSGQLGKSCPQGTKRRGGGKGYSNFSVTTGNCSLALARDFTTTASALSGEVLREVAISLTRRYFARSSIFFSRKERGLLRLRETRLLRTTATSRSDPVRMRSEFSLKRCFQSW